MTVDTDPYVAIIDELACSYEGLFSRASVAADRAGPETFSSRSPRSRRTFRSWLPERPRNG